MFESLQHCDPSMYVHIVVGSGSYKTSTTNMDHHKKKQIACYLHSLGMCLLFVQRRLAVAVFQHLHRDISRLQLCFQCVDARRYNSQ